MEATGPRRRAAKALGEGARPFSDSGRQPGCFDREPSWRKVSSPEGGTTATASADAPGYRIPARRRVPLGGAWAGDRPIAMRMCAREGRDPILSCSGEG